jgi:hypothetical protein
MNFWNAFFPGQISNQPVIAKELEGDAIDLEGNELRVVELGQSETQDSTCLYVRRGNVLPVMVPTYSWWKSSSLPLASQGRDTRLRPTIRPTVRLSFESNRIDHF